MALQSQRVVLGAADPVVLHGNPAPVIDSIIETALGGQTSYDDAPVARASGNRGHTTQAAQGVIVSSSQGIGSLREQCSEYGSTHSRQGHQDRSITLPGRLCCRPVVACSELLRAVLQALKGLAQLLIEHVETAAENLDVSGGRCGCTRGHREWIGAQSGQDSSRIKASDAMCFQQLGDGSLAHHAGAVRRGDDSPQGQHPVIGEVAAKVKELWVIAPQLVTQAVTEARPQAGQLFGNAGPLAQLNQERIKRFQTAQTTGVGAQCIGKHRGIAAVILGSCWRETVTEAVELSGVDGMDLEATVEQTFDNRAVRNLNRHLHQLRLRLCKFEDPARHAGKTLASVLEDLFSEPVPVGLQHTDMVRLGRPIDAHLELFLMHVLLLLANV